MLSFTQLNRDSLFSCISRLLSHPPLFPSVLFILISSSAAFTFFMLASGLNSDKCLSMTRLLLTVLSVASSVTGLLNDNPS